MSDTFQKFVIVIGLVAIAIGVMIASGVQVPGVDNPSPTQPEVDREGPEDRNN